jgi:hypothetical protein
MATKAGTNRGSTRKKPRRPSLVPEDRAVHFSTNYAIVIDGEVIYAEENGKEVPVAEYTRSEARSRRGRGARRPGGRAR